MSPRLTGHPSTPGLRRFRCAHSIAAAADAFVTVSLAGSLFFEVSPDASHQQVLIYLTVAMARLAVLAPPVGPSIDRFQGGGHRWLAVLLDVNRAGLAIAVGGSVAAGVAVFGNSQQAFPDRSLAARVSKMRLPLASATRISIFA